MSAVLGALYSNGLGVDQDEEAGFNLYLQVPPLTLVCHYSLYLCIGERLHACQHRHCTRI